MGRRGARGCEKLGPEHRGAQSRACNSHLGTQRPLRGRRAAGHHLFGGLHPGSARGSRGWGRSTAGAPGRVWCCQERPLTALRGQQVLRGAAVVRAQPVGLAARQPAGQAHAQRRRRQPAAAQQAAHGAEAAHACSSAGGWVGEWGGGVAASAAARTWHARGMCKAGATLCNAWPAHVAARCARPDLACPWGPCPPGPCRQSGGGARPAAAPGGARQSRRSPCPGPAGGEAREGGGRHAALLRGPWRLRPASYTASHWRPGRLPHMQKRRACRHFNHPPQVSAPSPTLPRCAPAC